MDAKQVWNDVISGHQEQEYQASPVIGTTKPASPAAADQSDILPRFDRAFFRVMLRRSPKSPECGTFRSGQWLAELRPIKETEKVRTLGSLLADLQENTR